MSQIDRHMEPIGRRRGAMTPFSSVATLVASPHGILTDRSVRGPWLPRVWRTLHAALGPAVKTLSTWRERARMRQRLLLLDDRLLRDIGIDRVQARGEADKPFWRV